MKTNRQTAILFLLSTLFISNYKVTAYPNIIKVKGTKYEMGYQYGKQLKPVLTRTLKLVKDYYIIQHKIPCKNLITAADKFYSKFPLEYQDLIKGAAKGSGLKLEEMKILNSMEILTGLLQKSKPKNFSCTFGYIPGGKSSTGETIIVRNYDFNDFYKQIAKELTITFFFPKDALPVATIALPGELYCPNGINSKGIFLAINNGMPSGGNYIDYNKDTLLINLLFALENSKNITELNKYLNTIKSDYSLIINIATHNLIESYEYTSKDNFKVLTPNSDSFFVSANFYQSPNWKNIPPPTDKNSWMSVTRRKNLIKQLESSNKKISPKSLMAKLNKTIKEGGAKWNYTIYQIVLDFKNQKLYVNSPASNNGWTLINLSKYFNKIMN